MTDDGEGRKDGQRMHSLAWRLASEIGISEAEAYSLIELIGTEWGSLLREARFLKSQSRPS